MDQVLQDKVALVHNEIVRLREERWDNHVANVERREALENAQIERQEVVARAEMKAQLEKQLAKEKAKLKRLERGPGFETFTGRTFNFSHRGYSLPVFLGLGAVALMVFYGIVMSF